MGFRRRPRAGRNVIIGNQPYALSAGPGLRPSGWILRFVRPMSRSEVRRTRPSRPSCGGGRRPTPRFPRWPPSARRAAMECHILSVQVPLVKGILCAGLLLGRSASSARNRDEAGDHRRSALPNRTRHLSCQTVSMTARCAFRSALDRAVPYQIGEGKNAPALHYGEFGTGPTSIPTR